MSTFRFEIVMECSEDVRESVIRVLDNTLPFMADNVIVVSDEILNCMWCKEQFLSLSKDMCGQNPTGSVYHQTQDEYEREFPAESRPVT